RARELPGQHRRDLPEDVRRRAGGEVRVDAFTETEGCEMNTGAAAGGEAGGPFLAIAIMIGFSIFFPLLWSAIVVGMSHIGGWHRLAQTYAHPETPAGETYNGQSCAFGF